MSNSISKMNPQTVIEVQCENLSSRLEYVLDFIGKHLGVNFRMTPDHRTSSSENIQICYGSKPPSNNISIFASGFLAENSIRSFEPKVSKENNLTLLFPAPEGYSLHMDLFSAIFYLLSRYEEYLPFKADRHGRFEASESIAYRHDFLDEPVIDQWMKQFKAILKDHYPGIEFQKKSFHFQPTLDVDQPWAYKNMSLLRVFKKFSGHLFRSEFKQAWNLVLTRLGHLHDCFDTFDYLKNLESQYGYTCPFFFLSGNKSPFDTNFSLQSMEFQNLIRSIKQDRTVGIHPSYHSNADFRELQQEYEQFSLRLGTAPIWSRQHFLKLSLPETYRNLIKLGIQADFSMGYVSATGFRAGTSLPFKFYDLQREETTALEIHPFEIMDVTLQQYLQLSPQDALQKTIEFIRRIKDVDGVFCTIWHNESLSETKHWTNWRMVFEGMVYESLK